MEKRLAKIGKNDVCQCGSGKKYRRCCKGKGVRFAYLEFSGRKFAYNLDIVNAHLTRLSDFCYKNIITPFNHRCAVDRSAGLNILLEFYALLDNILAPFLANSSCTKGCKECCNLVVDTTPIEVDLIREYIEEHFDRDAKTAMVSQIEKAADRYSDPALLGNKYAHLKVERYLHSQLHCPFYSAQGTCRIYPARPLGCRTHIVYSPPEECRRRKTIDYYEGGYFPHIYKAVECLSQLTHPDIRYEKHLPDWFVQEFKITY